MTSANLYLLGAALCFLGAVVIAAGQILIGILKRRERRKLSIGDTASPR